MENGPFEDVCPIENKDIPIAMLVYQRSKSKILFSYPVIYQSPRGILTQLRPSQLIMAADIPIAFVLKVGGERSLGNRDDLWAPLK